MKKIIVIVFSIILFAIIGIFLLIYLYNFTKDDEFVISRGSAESQIDFIPSSNSGEIRQIPIIFYKDEDIAIWNPYRQIINIYSNNGKLKEFIVVKERFKERVVTGFDYSSELGFVTLSIINKDLASIFDKNISEDELEDMGININTLSQLSIGEEPGIINIDITSVENLFFGSGLIQENDIYIAEDGKSILNTSNATFYEVIKDKLEVRVAEQQGFKTFLAESTINFTFNSNTNLLLDVIYQNEEISVGYKTKKSEFELLKDVNFNQASIYILDSQNDLIELYENVIDLDISLKMNELLLLIYDEKSDEFQVKRVSLK